MTDANVSTGIEPNDYFVELKGKVNDADMAVIDANRAVISREIAKAKALGQTNLLHKTAYIWQVLDRERIAITRGIVKFVYRADVTKLIDNVVPAKSIRVVELEKFPRVIPDANAEDIRKVQELGIFDQFIVVYTDFTDEDVSTPEQKAYVQRNTDPVVFGMFFNEKLNFKHDRLYFVTDWEDEFCDLTFTRMINKMGELGIENAEQTLSEFGSSANEIANEAMIEVDKFELRGSFSTEPRVSGFKKMRQAIARFVNG